MDLWKMKTSIGLYSVILVILVACSMGKSDQGVARDAKSESCRLSSLQMELPIPLFLSYACAECFYFIYGIDPLYSAKYHFRRCITGIRVCEGKGARSLRQCNCTNGPVYNFPEFANESVHFSQLQLDPPLPVDFTKLTRDCCRQAETCCKRVTTQKVTNESQVIANDGRIASQGGACPATWDGWQCFESTPAGETYRGICPYYSYGRALAMTVIDANQHYSTKRCLESGEWFQRNADGIDKEWTEYGSCETSNYHEELAKYMVGLIAFGISVLSIVPALIIFTAYRALRIPRVAIHKNLLFSFFLIGVFYIFNNVFFVQRSDLSDQALLEGNYITCRLLFTIQLRFLRLATYTWQLNEGLYLYRLLVHAFEQQQSLRIYYLLGWVFPVIPTLVYTAVKYLDASGGTRHDDFLRRCWIPYDNDWIEWITYGPCIVSLGINLIIMVVIMRVLIKKLRHNPENEPAQYRKAVRATLVLLPVFGLHFFITIYRMRSVLIYDLMNRVLDGLQGFIVAVIICYTNGEVLSLIRATVNKIKMKRNYQRERSHSMKTFQATLSQMDAEPVDPLLEANRAAIS